MTRPYELWLDLDQFDLLTYPLNLKDQVKEGLGMSLINDKMHGISLKKVLLLMSLEYSQAIKWGG